MRAVLASGGVIFAMHEKAVLRHFQHFCQFSRNLFSTQFPVAFRRLLFPSTGRRFCFSVSTACPVFHAGHVMWWIWPVKMHRIRCHIILTFTFITFDVTYMFITYYGVTTVTVTYHHVHHIRCHIYVRHIRCHIILSSHTMSHTFVISLM